MPLWVCVARHAQITQSKFPISLQYLKENMKDEVDFLPVDECQRFLQMIPSFWVCVARHAQISQNNKFAISLQYLKKEVSDEVDFLHANKHGSAL